MDRLLEAFGKFIEKSRLKVRGIIAGAIESVKFNFTAEEMERVYAELNNESICKYLELIKEVEGGSLKDAV